MFIVLSTSSGLSVLSVSYRTRGRTTAHITPTYNGVSYKNIVYSNSIQFGHKTIFNFFSLHTLRKEKNFFKQIFDLSINS